MIGLTNSTLIEIRGPGLPDRGGDVNPDGTVLWTGRAPGYLKRKRRTVVSGGVQVRDDQDILTILDTAGAPVSELAGPDWEATSVVIIDERTSTPVTRRFTVDVMEHRAAGTPVDSLRIELSAETAVA